MDEEDLDYTTLWESADNSVYCAYCPEELDRENTKSCIECGRPICRDCNTTICFESFCPQCAVCKTCGQEACFSCDRCSELKCPDHVAERHYNEDSTGYRETLLICDKCRVVLEGN